MTDLPDGILFVGGPSDGRRHRAVIDQANVTPLPGVKWPPEPNAPPSTVLCYSKRYLPGGTEVMALEGLSYADVLRRLVECYRP